ncbi:MAG: NRDE family protein [Verrucomicrobiota bacterium]
MCTMTWWRGENTYEVFFNRDEQKKRRPALPPTRQRAKGVSFLAPTDTVGGGTWIFCNEWGVTMALLNLYEKEEPSGPKKGQRFVSRGRLLSSLVDVKSASEVAPRLDDFAAASFQPFTLVAVDPGQTNSTLLWRYQNQRFEGPVLDPPLPLSSSSADTANVLESRRQCFALLEQQEGQCPEMMEQFHHHDNGEPSSMTVRMNRPDAQTLSISRIRVEPGQAEFLYQDQPPDLEGEHPPEKSVSLRLRSA